MTNVSVYQDSHLYFDPDGYILKIKGKPVELSATEYRLLHLMVTNRGRLLTHRQILLSIWGFEYIDDVDYVRIFIHHLRHKIELDPAQPRYITSVNGLGYRSNFLPDGEAKGGGDPCIGCGISWLPSV